MNTVGQPPRAPKAGLVHAQHPNRFRLHELDRAVHDHRPLHRRPRHLVRRGDLGLVTPVLHRPRQRRPQPCRRAHPGRHLRNLLGERLQAAKLGSAPPATLTPLHRDLPTTTGQ